MRCLHALGRTIQKKKDIQGPTLGAKEAQRNTRSFTEKQLYEATAAVSILNMGSLNIMERSHIDRTADFGAKAFAAGMNFMIF